MEQKEALLTKTQRKFLTGERTYDGEYAKQQRYQRRRAIQERVFSGLLDGGILWQDLPAEQREEIFDAWREDPPADESWGLLTREDNRRRDQFRRGLTGLLAMIYAGVEENDHLGFGFKDILGDAVASAVHARGDVLDSYDFDVETSPSFNTSALLERFESGDPSMTMLEIQHLREEAGIGDEEMSAYRDRMTGDASPIGFVGDDFDIQKAIEERDEE